MSCITQIKNLSALKDLDREVAIDHADDLYDVCTLFKANGWFMQLVTMSEKFQRTQNNGCLHRVMSAFFFTFFDKRTRVAPPVSGRGGGGDSS